MRSVKLTIGFVFFSSMLTSIAAFGQSGSNCPQVRTRQDVLSEGASAFLLKEMGSLSGPRREVLLDFYVPCDFALAWTKDGNLTRQALLMIDQLNHADTKGLRTEDYHAAAWGARSCALDIRCDDRPIEVAQFDLDLSMAIMRYVSDLMYGRATPINKEAGYTTRPDPALVAGFVWSKLVHGDDIASILKTLDPQAPGFSRTQAALQYYLKLQDASWDVPLPTDLRVLHPGDITPAVEPLATRLRALGVLPSGSAKTVHATFDGELVDAVKQFQETHGLASTGVVDAKTWAELMVPLHQRVNQLAYTMERWRGVPHNLGEPPIVVNIPEFRLRAYDKDGHVQLSMKVVVGRAGNRKTPALQAHLTEVTFHPYWNVPPDIAAREFGRRILGNSAYLNAEGYQVLDRSGHIITPTAEAVRGLASGAYRIRQVPGSKNALGQIKFSFPNSFNVYMHGTPQTSLFAESKRDFSHGCIRVEDPKALASWVLKGQGGWSDLRIDESLSDPTSRVVHLDHGIPVLLVYGTGIAAEDGEIRFFADIYGYDASLQKTLDQLSQARNKTDGQSW